MKTQRKTRNTSHSIKAKKLTLGELIAATYKAVGEKGAPKLLKLAIESQLVRYSPKPSYF